MAKTSSLPSTLLGCLIPASGAGRDSQDEFAMTIEAGPAWRGFGDERAGDGMQGFTPIPDNAPDLDHAWTF
jgi:hypothetical protein